GKLGRAVEVTRTWRTLHFIWIFGFGFYFIWLPVIIMFVSRLFVEKLPSHRDYHQCSSSPEKVFIMKKLQDVAFPRREELKKRLEEKYSSEYTDYLSKLHRASLLAHGSGGRGQWLEAERQRVAELRKRQIETEQFLRFESSCRDRSEPIRERNR
uniref:USP8 dimerisation domain-containing protein n=1 Tax=Neogobius melanostomus TaxID=47308 RepID=A0A8C6T2C2_9GOBI